MYFSGAGQDQIRQAARLASRQPLNLYVQYYLMPGTKPFVNLAEIFSKILLSIALFLFSL